MENRSIRVELVVSQNEEVSLTRRQRKLVDSENFALYTVKCPRIL